MSNEKHINSIYMKMIQVNMILIGLGEDNENLVFTDEEIDFIKNLE